MNIVTLSGWGQGHDSLKTIAPSAIHFDYSGFNSVEDAFAELGKIECDVIIGWSLGGQLALRAVEQVILKPQKIILIAAPFQFVKSSDIEFATSGVVFDTFLASFKNFPEKTLRGFASLIAKGDINDREIICKLSQMQTEEPLRWLYWLEELGNFSCSVIDFASIPETTIIHGKNDIVTDYRQTDFFKKHITNCNLHILDNCGHAPHLHDSHKVKELLSY